MVTIVVEHSWTITSGDDTIGGGSGSAGIDQTLAFTVGGAAAVEGWCTDPAAPEYNADATLDDGSCYAACTGNTSYISDGYCDSSNNNDGCAYDGGDCCPGDCVDATYPCAIYGGDCGTCIDPASADLADGGQCTNLECAADEFDCAGDGTQCIPLTYVFDGFFVDCSNGADEVKHLIAYTFCLVVQDQY